MSEEPCPLVEASAFGEPSVHHCPACGGEVISTETPTQFRCKSSGEVFYVEL